MPAIPFPLRVLIADDCRDAAHTLEVLIRMWGHDARVAFDGAAALSAADTYRPHVVLLDIAMPRVDGYEVARRLRQTPGLEDICLVAVSGYGQAEDVRRGSEAGFHHHLIKPFDLDHLRGLLDSVVETGTCG